MSDEKTTIINVNFNNFKNERWKSCIIIEGDQIGKVFDLNKQHNIIGRTKDADIHLNSSTVSRRHAEIIINSKGSIIIEDLNSSNGTYVNGKRILKAELHDGDIFSVGIYKLKLTSLSEHDTVFFKHLKDRAEKDALTGIYNKTSVMQLLDTILEEAANNKKQVSVAMVDIDFFKKINDTYGHLAGDMILKDIARLFSLHLRSMDTIGRFGGEEFLIIFDRTSLQDAKLICNRLLKVIRDHSTIYEGNSISVTVSIGLASNENKDIANAESLIKLADEKLYLAKEKGRNQIVF
jgi:diguanylate cyclase (GGDEF)-like protein